MLVVSQEFQYEWDLLLCLDLLVGYILFIAWMTVSLVAVKSDSALTFHVQYGCISCPLNPLCKDGGDDTVCPAEEIQDWKN